MEEKKEEKKQYGYCMDCRKVTEQKAYPSVYHRESMEHSQDFECLRCHRIKTVWI